jgi:hypothetical protein
MRACHVLWNHLKTVLIVLAGIAAGAGIHMFVVSEAKLSVETYGRARVEVIRRHLAEAARGYVFIAGDSHAELFTADYIPCGGRAINGGISGATAATYAALLEQVSFRRPPATIVLTIGTNDLLRKKTPGRPENTERFLRDVRTLIERFQAAAPRVIVNAIPPVGEGLRDVIDTAAIETHSRRLQGLCGAMNCEFADPFVTLRAAEFGIAKPGAMGDMLHAASYRRAYGEIGDEICRPSGSLAQSR